MGFIEREADNWWHSLPTERRVGIWRWIATREARLHLDIEGQQELPMNFPTSPLNDRDT